MKKIILFGASFLLVGQAFAETSATDKIKQMGVTVPGIPAEILDKPVKAKPGTASKPLAKEKVKAKPKKAVVKHDVKKHVVTKPAPIQEAKKVVVKPMQKKVARTSNRLAFKSRLDIQVESGVNEIIKVAQGHLNRIVTPFEHVAIDTVSGATIETHDSTVLVSTNETYPITMFLHEKGDDSLTMSITLLPEAIPPRDITLVFKGLTYNAMMRKVSKKAARWEAEHNYINGIKDAMRKLADGSIPDSYSFRPADENDRRFDCQSKAQGIRVELGQVMDGYNVIYSVSSVTNTSASTIELTESYCYEKGVIAVAFWPKVRLKAGEKTELYIAYKRPEENSGPVRPSLIGR